MKFIRIRIRIGIRTSTGNSSRILLVIRVDWSMNASLIGVVDTADTAAHPTTIIRVTAARSNLLILLVLVLLI